MVVGRYASDNDLLRDPYWKKYRKQNKTDKRKARLAHQCQLYSYRTHIKYMFGVRVPTKNHKEALEIDKENGKQYQMGQL